MWPSSQRPWKLFLNQKGQEGTRTKKGTHTGAMESKKEASVVCKWKGSGEREARVLQQKTGWEGSTESKWPQCYASISNAYIAGGLALGGQSHSCSWH